VAVMDIRKMHMRMCHWLMPVRMRMKLFPIRRKIMLVLMMRVVAVLMGVFHHVMGQLTCK
jgi:hypothetical protein